MDLIALVTSVTPDRSVGFTLTVVIAGLGIVLGTLAVLIVVFYAFGTAVSKTQDKARKKQAKDMEKQLEALSQTPVVPAPTAKAPQPVVESGISGEVVAAISAAVHELEGGTAVIKSITPVKKQSPISGRNPWAQAAVIDNTRPF